MQQLLQLIEKFNAGTATEEEKLLLLTALQKQDTAFQQLMQQYYLADLEKKIQELPSGRSGPILEAIKAQIQQRKIYPISIPWYKRSATWAAAAVLVVVAGIGLMVTKTIKPNHPVTASSTPAVPLLKKIHNPGKVPMNIELEDHSIVTLQPNSTISYAAHFPGDKREIQLSGKALFAVAKNAKKPFTVFAHGIATTALGTRFIVNEQEAAIVTVTLLEGRVVVRSSDSMYATMQVVYLQPGQEAVANLAQHTCKVLQTPAPANVTYDVGANTTANNTTGFNYNRTPLVQVLQQLSSHYQVHFQYDKNELKTLRFTGALNAVDSLDVILNMLGTTNNLRFTRDHNNIVITRQP